MSNDIYEKLVDLYAGRELPSELDETLHQAAQTDPALHRDMQTMRTTVDALRNDTSVSFTEESYQRILMKVYAKGADIQTRSQAPAHLQYQLPMQG